MNKDLRRIHHLTEDESKLLMLYRHLSLSAQASLTNIAEIQINEDTKLHDNVVSIGSRTVSK
jgi:hypothetical protein